MNKGLKIAIGIATIGVLGTAGYFIYKAIKDARDGNDENNPPVDPPADVVGGKEDSSEKTPFKNKAQGNLFREWINKFYPTYAKANDIIVSGDFDNAFIRKAWGKYADAYKKGSPNFLKVKGNAIPEVLLKAYNTKKDKGVLGSNSSGDIYLRTTTLGKLISKETYAYFYGSGKVNFLVGSTRVASGKWWNNGKNISIDNKNSFAWASEYGDVVVKLSFDGNLAGDLDAPSRRGLGLDMNIID